VSDKRQRRTSMIFVTMTNRPYILCLLAVSLAENLFYDKLAEVIRLVSVRIEHRDDGIKGI
jgi:hypothetical protein